MDLRGWMVEPIDRGSVLLFKQEESLLYDVEPAVNRQPGFCRGLVEQKRMCPRFDTDAFSCEFQNK